MKGNYKIGIVVLLFLAVTTASAITEIGDNIIATWVNASFFKGDGTQISGLNGSNITSGSVPTAVMPAGTLILLYTNETDASGLADLNMTMNYDVAANSYSRIMVESEVGVNQTAVGTANAEADFNLTYAHVLKQQIPLKLVGNNAADLHKIAAVVKYSEPFTGGGNVKMAVKVIGMTSGDGLWFVYSFRVYGVV